MHNEKEKKKKTQKKKKINTTKLSYRSSEGRSSSRHFRKYQNYEGKTSRIIRNANIHAVVSTEESEEIHSDIRRILKNAFSVQTFINNCKHADFRTSEIRFSAETSCEF